MTYYTCSLLFFYKTDACPVTGSFCLCLAPCAYFLDCIVLWSEAVYQICQGNLSSAFKCACRAFQHMIFLGNLTVPVLVTMLNDCSQVSLIFGTYSYEDPQSNVSFLSENSWFLCSACRLSFPGVKCYTEVFQGLNSRCETCISLFGRDGNLSSSREWQGLKVSNPYLPLNVFR